MTLKVEVKWLCTIIISIVGAVTTLMGGAYMFGCYNREAEKNLEFQIYQTELIQKHREEMNRKDDIIRSQQQEIYELQRENLLHLKERSPSNNSP